MNYKEYFHNEIQDLILYLRRNGICEETINSMVESGYVLISDFILDTYYGLNLRYHPPITIDKVKYYQSNGSWNKSIPSCYKTYFVNNINDIFQIVEELKKQYKNILYRGATNHYTFKRSFPNPFFSDENDCEISLIPSFFRKFSENYMSRESFDLSRTSFDDPILHDLFYKDFNYTLELFKNKKIDFEEFYWMSEDNREMMWQDDIRKVDLYTLKQHYGFDSNVLDVTYNIETALFFSFNKLVKVKENFYDYTLIDKTEYKNPVLYILIPQTDLPNITEWEYQKINVKGIECVRPIRQKCTSLPVDIDSMNRAASEVKAVIKFNENFSLPDNIPKKEYLFPSVDEDPFYKYLLENEYAKDKAMRYIYHYQ